MRVRSADVRAAWGWRLLLIAAVAAIWEAAGRLGWVDPELLPPLSKIFVALWRLLEDTGFRSDLWITIAECLIAFAIVAPLGLASGFLLGERPRLEKLFGPALQLLMTVPKSVFLPVFILLFGIGLQEKIIFAVALAYFIVVPTGIAAVHAVPRGLVVAARAFGASRRQVYTQIYLPAVTPIILSGARLGLIFTIHGIIFAEMYASSEGIGRRILDWGESFQMQPMLAAVLLVLIVTVALNESMQFIERYTRSRLSLGAKS
ncbi:MAG TPA: ABC transporter permease subunit [Xanthobacteraceae bacterium]|nr:ABC transporter permease subunit [Xanthobacteraceae bacterium]